MWPILRERPRPTGDADLDRRERHAEMSAQVVERRGDDVVVGAIER